MRIVCSNCNTSNVENAQFCKGCGEPLIKQNEVKPKNKKYSIIIVVVVIILVFITYTIVSAMKSKNEVEGIISNEIDVIVPFLCSAVKENNNAYDPAIITHLAPEHSAFNIWATTENAENVQNASVENVSGIRPTLYGSNESIHYYFVDNGIQIEAPDEDTKKFIEEKLIAKKLRIIESKLDGFDMPTAVTFQCGFDAKKEKRSRNTSEKPPVKAMIVEHTETEAPFEASRSDKKYTTDTTLASLFTKSININDEEYSELKRISPAYANADNQLNQAFSKLRKELTASNREKLKQDQIRWIDKRNKQAYNVGEKGSEAYIQSLIEQSNQREQELLLSIPKKIATHGEDSYLDDQMKQLENFDR